MQSECLLLGLGVQRARPFGLNGLAAAAPAGCRELTSDWRAHRKFLPTTVNQFLADLIETRHLAGEHQLGGRKNHYGSKSAARHAGRPALLQQKLAEIDLRI